MSKIMRWCKQFVVTVIVCMTWGSMALAYESGKVTNGGTIIGKVTLRGSIPEPRAFPMVLYPFGDFCKKISDGEGLVLLKEFNVDDAGGLQDAVVAVQDIKRGKSFRSGDTDQSKSFSKGREYKQARSLI